MTELIQRIDDLAAQLTDLRRIMCRIETELEPIRRLVVSHGQRLAQIERDSLTPPPRPYTENDHG